MVAEFRGGASDIIFAEAHLRYRVSSLFPICDRAARNGLHLAPSLGRQSRGIKGVPVMQPPSRGGQPEFDILKFLAS